MIRAAFNLGTKTKPPLVGRVPVFAMDPLDNVRQGTLKAADYERLRDAFDPTAEHARLFLVLAYHMGNRTGELMQLTWDRVELDGKGGGTITFGKKTTKGGYARSAPIWGDMVIHLYRALEMKHPDCDRVIQFEGRAVKCIKRAWATACEAAGLPDLLKHDLRRVGVTRMVKKGVPQTMALAVAGHKTDSMLRRYLITDKETALEVGTILQRSFEVEKAEKAAARAERGVSSATVSATRLT